jgi:hypothetical protein
MLPYLPTPVLMWTHEGRSPASQRLFAQCAAEPGDRHRAARSSAARARARQVWRQAISAEEGSRRKLKRRAAGREVASQFARAPKGTSPNGSAPNRSAPARKVGLHDLCYLASRGETHPRPPRHPRTSLRPKPHRPAHPAQHRAAFRASGRRRCGSTIRHQSMESRAHAREAALDRSTSLLALSAASTRRSGRALGPSGRERLPAGRQRLLSVAPLYRLPRQQARGIPAGRPRVQSHEARPCLPPPDLASTAASP